MSEQQSKTYTATGKYCEDIKANKVIYQRGVASAHPELGDRLLKIIPEMKDAFVASIDGLAKLDLKNPLTNDPNYAHGIAFGEALVEAAFYFYDKREERQVQDISGNFARMINARSLSDSLNKLWTGTPNRITDDFNRALFGLISEYAVENGFAEWAEKDPLREVFDLAEEAIATAPARTPSSRIAACKLQ